METRRSLYDCLYLALAEAAFLLVLADFEPDLDQEDAGIDIVGCDVVEVCPAYDGPGQVTALVAAGMGWLARKYGFAADSLLRVDIVTADGHQNLTAGVPKEIADMEAVCVR